MTTRPNEVSIYVSDELDREISARADAADMSKSRWAAQQLDRVVENDVAASKMREARIEDRIEELVSLATDEIVETMGATREINAKTGVYAIAVWELLKTDFSDGQRRQMLSVGSERLRDDLENLGVDVDAVLDGLETEDSDTFDDSDIDDGGYFG